MSLDMTTARSSNRPPTLADLPPELWSHITNYLPTTSSVASLQQTNKVLHTYVAKDGWKTFARARFPSICPPHSPQYAATVRSLSTSSRAWDRQAVVARYIDVEGEIWKFPGRHRIPRWDLPEGQTIGFAPQLDVKESVGVRWQDRHETLAFSAGAGICVRQTDTDSKSDAQRWMIYRPTSAGEGRDDVTTLHVLEPPAKGGWRTIAGTANGDLRLITFPTIGSDNKTEVDVTSFRTDGLPVRSGSVLEQPDHPSLFAAALGDAKVALYSVGTSKSEVESLSQVDILPPLRADGHPSASHRVWTTSLLSSTSLAVGTGASHEPIQVYALTPTGITKPPLHKYDLQSSDRTHAVGARSQPTSSIYSIVPLPNTSQPGQLFLSGAYDGIIRLHDQRSPHAAVQEYIDPADDSAIYSLLPRGQEKLLAGAGRHNLLKVFDLRLGAKCYDYLDARLSSTSPEANGVPSNPDSQGSAGRTNGAGATTSEAQSNASRPSGQDRDSLPSKSYNLFLRDHTPRAPSSRTTNNGFRGNALSRSRNGARYQRGGGGGGGRGTHGSSSADSSVYSLAAANAWTARIYAGVENAVVGLMWTELGTEQDPYLGMDEFMAGHGDGGGSGLAGGGREGTGAARRAAGLMCLGMYEQDAEMRLSVQREWKGGRETGRGGGTRGWRDGRWRDAAEMP